MGEDAIKKYVDTMVHQVVEKKIIQYTDKLLDRILAIPGIHQFSEQIVDAAREMEVEETPVGTPPPSILN